MTPAEPSKQGGAKFVSRSEVTNVGDGRNLISIQCVALLFIAYPSFIELIFSVSDKCREKRHEQRKYRQNSTPQIDGYYQFTRFSLVVHYKQFGSTFPFLPDQTIIIIISVHFSA